MEVSFRANLVNKTTVKKRGWFSGHYKPKEASFIKLDLQSEVDVQVLNRLKKLWTNSFVGQIYHDVTKTSCPVEVYALTTQADKFEKLEPQKILGVAETIGDDSYIKLEYLQTHPKYIYDEDKKDRKYAGVGTVLLNQLKNMPDMRQIKLISIFSALDFYEKNGFKLANNLEESVLVWRKE